MTDTTEAAMASAARMYEAALNAWGLAAESLRDAQARMRAGQQTLIDLTIPLRFDPAIDGKNAETRDAQLRQLQLGDTDYLETETGIEQARRDEARWRDEASTARDRMALAKRQMEWCIAHRRFQTEQGGEDDASR